MILIFVVHVIIRTPHIYYRRDSNKSSNKFTSISYWKIKYLGPVRRYERITTQWDDHQWYQPIHWYRTLVKSTWLCAIRIFVIQLWPFRQFLCKEIRECRHIGAGIKHDIKSGAKSVGPLHELSVDGKGGDASHTKCTSPSDRVHSSNRQGLEHSLIGSFLCDGFLLKIESVVGPWSTTVSSPSLEGNCFS